MSSRFRFSRRRAFTLVELLVVIGIIAVLVSFLLPALNRARDSAKTVQCLSNIKQLATYVILYANDNKGFVPVAKYQKAAAEPPVTASTISLTWEEPLLPYLDAKFKTINTPNLDQLSDRGRSILFGCPIWFEIWQRSGGPSILGSDPARNVGYGMNILPKAPDDYGGFPGTGGSLAAPANINWYEPGINRWGRQFKISEWKNPGQRAMFGDCKSPQMYVNPPSPTPGTTTLHARHARDKYVNIAFWDGSGQSLLINDARFAVRFKTP